MLYLPDRSEVDVPPNQAALMAYLSAEEMSLGEMMPRGFYFNISYPLFIFV
jgi:hypothetical protein